MVFGHLLFLSYTQIDALKRRKRFSKHRMVHRTPTVTPTILCTLWPRIIPHKAKTTQFGWFKWSKWWDSPSGRNLNRRDCPLDRSLVSVEKAADGISSTGGPRRLSPRPYRPRVRILASTRKIPDTRKGHPGFCVEVAGFEPAAFWSRTKRATKLRYTSSLEPIRGLEPLTC